MRRFFAKLIALFRRRADESEMDREVAAHLALLAEDFERSGMAPSEAHHAALRAFGGVELAREASRDARSFVWIEQASQDLRHALRSFTKSPAFALGVILTAALGIGANASIFSLVHAVLLQPLPYRDADRLMTIAGGPTGDFRYGAWRTQATVFDGMAAYMGRRHIMTGSGEAEQVLAHVVTPTFLSVLGVAPVLGRDFDNGDAQPRGGDKALISFRLWKNRFNGDANVTARGLQLDGKPYTIIGVLPRDFAFPDKTQPALLLAMSEPPPQPTGAVYYLKVIARLKPGVNPDRANRDLSLIDAKLKLAFPKQFSRGPRGAPRQLQSLREGLTGDARPALLVLWVAAGLVLLIVCANILNLLLARGLSRQRELAVRMALGADRARVARQLLTEGMLLSVAGGATGLAVAGFAVPGLLAMAPADVPQLADARVNSTVLFYTTGITMLVGLAFGLWPIRGLSGVQGRLALKQASRSLTASREQRGLESVLVVCEAALAFILLTGAGLMIQTLTTMTAIPPGFDPSNVVTGRLSLPYWKYAESGRSPVEKVAEIMTKLRDGPGVESVGAVAALPYGGFVMSSGLEIAGQPPLPEGEEVPVNFAAGEYFQTMRIPLLAGRTWDRGDTAGRPAVSVVTEELVRRYFHGQARAAVGARIRVKGVTPWLDVIGVVGDVKQAGLATPPKPMVYQPAAQSESGDSASTIVVRSSADPRVLLPWIRSLVLSLDTDLPPPDLATAQANITGLLASRVFLMRLLTAFAIVAILLAATGIYCVLAYSVERRLKEIGIRMALGAQSGQISAMILRRAVMLALGGTAVGVAGGWGLGRYLEASLYGVTPHDPATFAAGASLLLLVGVAAGYLPARAAAQQDVLSVLKIE